MNNKIDEDNLKKSELNIKIDQIRKNIDNFKKSLSETEIIKEKIQGLKEKQTRIENMDMKRKVLTQDLESMTKEVTQLTQTISDFNKYTIQYEEINLELTNILNGAHKLMITQAEFGKETQFLQIQITEINEQIDNLKKIKELDIKISDKNTPLIIISAVSEATFRRQ